MPSSVKSTITTLVFLGLLSSLTKSASAQDDFEPYTRLPDSQIVELYIEFNGEYANIFIYNMPEEVLGNSLIVRNLQNTCFGGTEITGKQFWIDMGNQYHYTDTFIVYFSNMYTDMLPYPAEVLLPGRSTTKISFGKDCYQLLCEPQNDPWMPSSHTPFLFKKKRVLPESRQRENKKGRKSTQLRPIRQL